MTWTDVFDALESQSDAIVVMGPEAQQLVGLDEANLVSWRSEKATCMATGAPRGRASARELIAAVRKMFDQKALPQNRPAWGQYGRSNLKIVAIRRAHDAGGLDGVAGDAPWLELQPNMSQAMSATIKPRQPGEPRPGLIRE